VNYDDEILMAYVDGERDERLSAEISAAMERDPALARRVERHRALRAKVAGAFTTVLDQPVPERLRAAARATPLAATCTHLAGDGRITCRC
jgi:anti-sigma factor RsiW